MELYTEDQINKAVAALGTSDDPTVRSGIVAAFTGRDTVCERCDQTLQLSNGRRFKARHNTPDHILSCPGCGFIHLVHEAKPKPATALAWNIPDTVRVLQHESVDEIWSGAGEIPETCLDEHEDWMVCEHVHDYYYKRPVLAVPQVLSYAWDTDAPVLVTCDDSKPQDMTALYDTNKDAPSYPFRLKPEWYPVRPNSEVISELISALDELTSERAEHESITAIVSSMLVFASEQTRDSVPQTPRFLAEDWTNTAMELRRTCSTCSPAAKRS